MTIVALLGPQRLQPTVGSVVEKLAVSGRLAAITSGWEERELEDDELTGHLGRQTVNLRLHHRREEILREAPELLPAIHAHVDRLTRMRDLYRARLTHAMAAARELFARDDTDADVLARNSAIAAVRTLDADHLSAVGRAQAELDAECNLDEHTAVVRHRQEIAQIVGECDAIAIAGGHVGRLLDQLRWFAIREHLHARPVLAWSAGAMALATRVMLFHDSPPQGPDNAEAHDDGLGLVAGTIALPHARRRLRLDDPVRVGILARRCAPCRCVVMDEGASLIVEDGTVTTHHDVRMLSADGAVVDLTTSGDTSP